MRIGVISDTHGLLRPEALDALRSSDAILHAGDVGAPEVLEALLALAPLHVIRGNNDTAAWARDLPDELDVTLARRRFHLVHDLKTLRTAGTWDAIVCGHSHQPRVERRGEQLVVNPGSAGPRRFKLPISVARLELTSREIHAELIKLSPR